ncbi:periplasmic heavy metal sensor [Acidomonas methanolica]|uniref:periplasmic heavy metal sensor n=1 Tax=Acidomonas methanolica TaxID=437 RepID=UPI00211A0940|nr:periplasmic heavy metal sensor [Acidomonas methanolica]MCQ9154191.1 periplasmic heavy metal sensor [Acidomonas methanolica]
MIFFDANGRPRRGVLIGSLLLNLFLVAVVGGQYLRHREGDGPVLMRVLQHVTSRLDAKDAAAFRTVLRQEAPRYAQAQENLARARAEIDRQLLAPHFDPVATRAAMQQWQAAWNVFVGSFSNALVEAMGRLSPAGRRALVNAAPHQRPDL